MPVKGFTKSEESKSEETPKATRKKGGTRKAKSTASSNGRKKGARGRGRATKAPKGNGYLVFEETSDGKYILHGEFAGNNGDAAVDAFLDQEEREDGEFHTVATGNFKKIAVETEVIKKRVRSH